MNWQELPDKIHRVSQRLMGVKKRVDPRTADGPVFADYQDRLLASAIDVTLLFVLLKDVFFIVSGFFNMDGYTAQLMSVYEGLDAYMPWIMKLWEVFLHGWQIGAVQAWVCNLFVQILLMAPLMVLCWVYYQQTPGKWLLGLKLAGANGEGVPTAKQCVVRYASFYVSLPLFFLGFALLGFDKKKRAWHDRIAGTTVIRTKEGSVFRRAWDLVTGLFLRWWRD